MSNIIATAPTTIVAGHSSRLMMDASLAELGLNGPANDLLGSYPSLLAAALRLTWHITAELLSPRTGRPILSHCLEAAVAAGVATKGSGRSVRSAFLIALLNNACMLMEIDVRSERERWDPLQDAPLSEWFPARAHARVDPRPARNVPLRSPVSFFAGIALRIVEPADLRELPMTMGSGVLVA